MRKRLFRRKRTNIHVVPLKRKWMVELENGENLDVFDNKVDAMKAARCAALAAQPSEVFEHNQSGEIVDRSTYPRSSDPVESKG